MKGPSLVSRSLSNCVGCISCSFFSRLVFMYSFFLCRFYSRFLYSSYSRCCWSSWALLGNIRSLLYCINSFEICLLPYGTPGLALTGSRVLTTNMAFVLSASLACIFCCWSLRAAIFFWYASYCYYFSIWYWAVSSSSTAFLPSSFVWYNIEKGENYIF